MIKKFYDKNSVYTPGIAVIQEKLGFIFTLKAS
jgi:hypothetical protein